MLSSIQTRQIPTGPTPPSRTRSPSQGPLRCRSGAPPSPTGPTPPSWTRRSGQGPLRCRSGAPPPPESAPSGLRVQFAGRQTGRQSPGDADGRAERRLRPARPARERIGAAELRAAPARPPPTSPGPPRPRGPSAVRALPPRGRAGAGPPASGPSRPRASAAKELFFSTLLWQFIRVSCRVLIPLSPDESLTEHV